MVERRAERLLGRRQVPARQRIATVRVRIKGGQHFRPHDIGSRMPGSCAPEQNGVGELAEFGLEVLAIFGDSNRMVAQLPPAAAQIIQSGRYLDGVADVDHVAPHQHAGTKVSGETLCPIQGHRQVPASSARIVQLQRICQTHVGPSSK